MTLDLKTRDNSQPSQVKPSLLRRLIGLYFAIVGTIRARRMLAEVIKPYRSRGSPGHIPRYLRQDLGLPPEPSRSNYWDHQ